MPPSITVFFISIVWMPVFHEESIWRALLCTSLYLVSWLRALGSFTLWRVLLPPSCFAGDLLEVKIPPAPCPSGRPPCSFPHTLLWGEMREERSLYTCRVCCLVGWWSLRDQELTGNPAPGPGCSGLWIANRSMGESHESHWDPRVFRQTYECEHHCNDAPFWRLSQSYLLQKSSSHCLVQ